jgi:DNA-binding GntR family transcriptional regulator
MSGRFERDIAISKPRVTGIAGDAYDRLREMLLAGVLPGGSVVQERRLAEELGLSRTPVREAFRRLEGEGLLRRQDRFLTVATVSMAEVMEILAVRGMLEAEAARAAAGRMRPESLQGVRRAIQKMKDAKSVTDDEHWAIDDLVHRTIAEESGNHLLAVLIMDLRRRTRLFGLRRQPKRFAPGKDEHLGILDAIESGDADEAAKRMRRHLDNARQAILATLSQQPA